MEQKDVIIFPYQIKDSCKGKLLNTLASVSQLLLIIVIELAGKYHSTFMYLKEWYFFFFFIWLEDGNQQTSALLMLIGGSKTRDQMLLTLYK